MMFGKADIVDGVLETRHTSYTLSNEINAKADRVFLTPAIAVSTLLGLFALGCWDLLYAGEKWAVLGFIVSAVIFGLIFTRLVIVKTSLRASELTTAGIGTYGTIRAKASMIVAAARGRDASQGFADVSTPTEGSDPC